MSTAHTTPREPPGYVHPTDGNDLGSPDAPRNALEAEFWKFHAANPHVYELFDQFTRQSIGAGRKHFSATIVFERIRWATMVETVGSPDFKMSNNHRPYYARLWMRNNPEHRGFFRTCEVRDEYVHEEVAA